MIKKLFFLAACLMLSGCGASAQVEPLPSANNLPSEPPALQTVSERLPEQLPKQLPGQSGAEQPEQQIPPAVQDYYMDKNFILRPKDANTDKMVVLLTFDDGPKDEKVLAHILDTLDRFEAKAIFFLNGYRAEKNPELVKLIAQRGQKIGNHSWDHIDLKKQPQEEMERQMDRVQTLVEELTGEAPVFFRPPFGSGGDAVKAKAESSGMLYMTWSNGSRDWEKGYDDPQKVIRSVLEQLHPGSNILMHELPWTAEALPDLLSALQEKGYAFLDPARIDRSYSKN